MADIYSFNAEMNEQQPELPAELVPSEQVHEAELTQEVRITNYDDTELRQLIAQRPAFEDLFIKGGYVTPQLFGAVGDGVNDDTDAFQMMLDADGTLGYYLPKGVYRITRPLSYTKGTMVLVGAASYHGHISGTIGKLTDAAISNVAKEASVIWFDCNQSNAVLLNPSNVYRLIIERVDFICRSYSCTVSSTGTHNETISTENVSCLDVPKGEIRDCSFVGFSGFGLKIAQQHGKLSGLSFFGCNKAILIDGSNTADYRLTDVWFCRCHTCITQMYNNSAHIQISNIWADQIYGRVFESQKQSYIRMTDGWFDTIGGAIIYTVASGLDRSAFVNCRFSRYALYQDDAAVQVPNIYSSYFQLTSNSTYNGGVAEKPLIKKTGSFTGNVVIAPKSVNIVNGTNDGTNLIISGNGMTLPDSALASTLSQSPSGWSFTEEQQSVAQQKLGILPVEEVLF